MERKSFLDQEPPPGYVAGVGRGATGFTTSADTGPVKFESSFGNEIADGKDGSELGILAQANKSKEDDEADRIYEEIENLMSSRHKKRKEESASEKHSAVEIPIGTGTIQQHFSSLKNGLAQVSMEEWANLPEVGDMTRRNKRQRLLDQQQQRTYAAPDVLISGTGTGFRDDNTVQDSNSSREAEINASKLAEIEEWEQKSAISADVDKGRLVLASLRKAEPYKADSWISSARLEEQAKQLSQARALITKGSDLIPHSDKIWLENIRLHRSQGTKVCKSIMSEALRLNSQSEKLWFAALDLENQGDVLSRRKILMKALQFLPSSPSLWKALIDMDTDDEEKIRLLARATELCPQEWDMWLNLVNISNYSDAKSVLNKARKQLPDEPRVWITALKLEEREKGEVALEKLVKMFDKGKKELQAHSFMKDPEEWLVYAHDAQKEGFAKSAQAIAISSLEGETSEDRLFELAGSSSGEVASYIYQQASSVHPTSINVWMRLLSTLKENTVKLYESYDKAIENIPDNEILPLMYAKDKWMLSSDVPAARAILEKASSHLRSNEKIWFARLKLEIRNAEIPRALAVAEEAVCALEDSPRAWLKRIHLLRYCYLAKYDGSNVETALQESKTALESFPDIPKVYLQRSQIMLDAEDKAGARECLSIGTKRCFDSAKLWQSLASLDLELSAGARARSVLDTAVSKSPNVPELWQAKIELEYAVKDAVAARQLINKALKSFPSCAKIWILYLKSIPKMSHRKNAFLDALKQTNNSTEILLAIGVFFWVDAKHSKAKAWFERALTSDKTNGEAWGWMYCFETRYGKEKDVEQLTKNYIASFDDIRVGTIWNSIVKNPRNLIKPPIELLQLVSKELASIKI